MLYPIFLNNMHFSDINPVVCGTNICDSGEIYPRHYIQRFVLHYVTKGCGVYWLNDTALPVAAGDVFVSQPGDATCYIADQEDPFTYIWVSFECKSLFSDLLVERVFPAPWAASIFTRIVDSKTTEIYICSLLFEFFSKLSERPVSGSTRKNEYVRKAMNYIETNYSEPIRISDMAAALGLSRNYFCRIFAAQVGMPPQDYLVSYRMEVAARLLTEDKLTQKETAERVGYTDICTFSRMFKRKHGISPGAYAKAADHD